MKKLLKKIEFNLATIVIMLTAIATIVLIFVRSLFFKESLGEVMSDFSITTIIGELSSMNLILSSIKDKRYYVSSEKSVLGLKWYKFKIMDWVYIFAGLITLLLTTLYIFNLFDIQYTVVKWFSSVTTVVTLIEYMCTQCTDIKKKKNEINLQIAQKCIEKYLMDKYQNKYKIVQKNKCILISLVNSPNDKIVLRDKAKLTKKDFKKIGLDNKDTEKVLNLLMKTEEINFIQFEGNILESYIS